MASIQINHTNQYGPYNTWPQQQWPHGYMPDYMNHMDSIAKIQGGSTPESQLDRRFSCLEDPFGDWAPKKLRNFCCTLTPRRLQDIYLISLFICCELVNLLFIYPPVIQHRFCGIHGQDHLPTHGQKLW